MQGNSRSARWSGDQGQPAAGEWFIAGLNGVREALRSPRIKVRRLYLDRRALGSDLAPELANFKGSIDESNHRDTPYGLIQQGVAALVLSPQQPGPEALLDQLERLGRVPLLVALDQVEDPMNLGQILRSCEAVGVDGVILLKHRSIHLNQTVAQVSQGAFAWLPVLEVTNLRNCLDDFKRRGLWIVGCDGSTDAKSWHQCPLGESLVLVFGAEGKGLRLLTRKTCHMLAALPMQGHVGSLNVGAAVSAFLYEAIRQRLLLKK